MSVSQQISVKTLSWIFYQSPFRIWLKIHTHSAHISKGWAMTTFNQFSLLDVKVIQDFGQKSLYWIQLNSLTLDLLLVLNLKITWNLCEIHVWKIVTVNPSWLIPRQVFDFMDQVNWTKILVTDSWVIQDLHITFPAKENIQPCNSQNKTQNVYSS